MVEESNRGRIWSSTRLQGAVKAAFFARGVELGKTEDSIRLRYSDIRRGIAATEGPVGDKSLSRTLWDLTSKGVLNRQKQGREVYYRLTVPRADRVAAFAKSDATGIQSASSVGGIGDLSEGWAFYGLPDLIRERLRKGLRRAALRFQREMIDLIDRQSEKVLSPAFRRARGSLSQAELRRVEGALHHLLQLQVTGAVAMIRGELAWRSIETVIPGSLSAWRRILGIPLDLPPLTLGWTDAHTEAFAKALGSPISELKELVAREQRKLELVGPLLARFFRAQGKRGAEELASELDALVITIVALTSVVRT